MAKKPTLKKTATPSSGRSDDKSKPVKMWEIRLTRATKDFDAWAKEYECDRLDRYYRGKHWQLLSEDERKNKYTLNLIFATVETQLPSLLFSQPKVKVEARPNHEQTADSNAAGRATLIEQTLQTRIDDPRMAFTYETTLALRDAYARFGIVEVGYTADYIDNPNADKPVLKGDDSGDPLLGEDKQPLLQPKQIRRPGSQESTFVKRLNPKNVRVSPGRPRLDTNDWVAYGDWYNLEDVKANKQYQNTLDLKEGGHLTNLPDERGAEDDDDIGRHAGQIWLWKIWDLRAKTRIVLAEGHKQLLQEGKPFTTLPLSVMKFYDLPDSFLPLPPIYNWLSPQDEINESREMQRTHRRRAKRFYMREPSVKVTEFEKLEDAPDMASIEVAKVNPSPIMPIPDAPLEGATWTQLAATHEDLDQITGVSGEARGVPKSPTATQANIVNVRAELRESRARTQVAAWLADICRLVLIQIREHMTLPFMVKETVDPFAAAANPQAVQQQAATWKQVKTEDIGDLDVDIKIDVSSLSPVAEDQQRQQWMGVLQLVTNPPVAHFLMADDPQNPGQPSPLLRKTLMLNSITSDVEIRAIWRIGKAAIAEAAQAAAAQAAANQPVDQPKISYSFKGEDLNNPLVLAAFVKAEGLQALAASQQREATASPPTLPPSITEGGGGVPPVALPPGPTTGTPVGAGGAVG